MYKNQNTSGDKIVIYNPLQGKQRMFQCFPTFSLNMSCPETLVAS